MNTKFLCTAIAWLKRGAFSLNQVFLCALNDDCAHANKELTSTMSHLYLSTTCNKAGVKLDFHTMGTFSPKKALLSKTEKCHCFPCSSIIYHHLMFSTSYFKSSLSTTSSKNINAMPLWDFLPSSFEVVLKIMTIAELFIIMTTSPG